MKLWSVAHFHSHFWVGLLLHPPKSEDGNGHLTRVAFKINEIHTLVAAMFNEMLINITKATKRLLG